MYKIIVLGCSYKSIFSTQPTKFTVLNCFTHFSLSGRMNRSNKIQPKHSKISEHRRYSPPVPPQSITKQAYLLHIFHGRPEDQQHLESDVS